MIFSKYFQKYFIIISLVLITTVTLGSVATRLIMETTIRAMVKPPRPNNMVGQLFNVIDQNQRIEIIQKIYNDTERNFEITLYDESGKVLFPLSETKNLSPNELQRLMAEGKGPDFAPPPPGRSRPIWEMFLPRRPMRGGWERRPQIFVLDGQPKQFLMLRPADFEFKAPPAFLFWLPLVINLGAILVGAGLALVLIFRSIKDKKQMADQVIAEMQKGNLSARFPITGKDEINQMMLRFNRMAGEIETLVDRMRTIEKTRMTLLQELAHDLRTPVASLKSLLETLSTKKENLPNNLREELMELSLKEVDYFERLVDDLLFLAQVSEPKYQHNKNHIPLNLLIQEEASTVGARYKGHNVQIIVDENKAEDVKIWGDNQLLRRLFRNVLENACSFAQAKVEIKLNTENKNIQVTIIDDGKGFSEDVIESFGKRRISRVVHKEDQQGRLSVGLGSVIMKTIVDVHRGQIEVTNNKNTSGAITGAQVLISLPTED